MLLGFGSVAWGGKKEIWLKSGFLMDAWTAMPKEISSCGKKCMYTIPESIEGKRYYQASFWKGISEVLWKVCHLYWLGNCCFHGSAFSRDQTSRGVYDNERVYVVNDERQGRSGGQFLTMGIGLYCV